MRKAQHLLQQCREKVIRLAVAESCTGGLLSAMLTDISGSSDVFDRGFVTYSNASKMELLGVPADIITIHGAVSEQTAQAMAEGTLAHSHAQLVASITGIAGPGGGNAKKPVGLVFLAVLDKQGAFTCERCLFPGGRQAIRKAAVDKTLDMLLEAVSQYKI